MQPTPVNGGSSKPLPLLYSLSTNEKAQKAFETIKTLAPPVLNSQQDRTAVPTFKIVFSPWSALASQQREVKALDPAALEIAGKLDSETGGKFSIFLKEMLPCSLFIDRYPIVNDFQFYFEQQFHELIKYNKDFYEEKPLEFFKVYNHLKHCICMIGAWAASANPEMSEEALAEKIDFKEIHKECLGMLERVSQSLSHLRSAVKDLCPQLNHGRGVNLVQIKLGSILNMMKGVNFLKLVLASEDKALLLSKRMDMVAGHQIHYQSFEKLPETILKLFAFAITDFSLPSLEVSMQTMKVEKHEEDDLKALCRGIAGELAQKQDEFKKLVQEGKLNLASLQMFIEKFCAVQDKILLYTTTPSTLEESLAVNFEYKKERSRAHVQKLMKGINSTSITCGKIMSHLLLLSSVYLCRCKKFDGSESRHLAYGLKDLSKLLVALAESDVFDQFTKVELEIPRECPLEQREELAKFEYFVEINNQIHTAVNDVLLKHLLRIHIKVKEGIVEDIVGKIEALARMENPDPRFVNDLIRHMDRHVFHDLKSLWSDLIEQIMVLMQKEETAFRLLDPSSEPQKIVLQLITENIERFINFFLLLNCCITGPMLVCENAYANFCLFNEDPENREIAKNLITLFSPDSDSAAVSRSAKKKHRKQTKPQAVLPVAVPSSTSKEAMPSALLPESLQPKLEDPQDSRANPPTLTASTSEISIPAAALKHAAKVPGKKAEAESAKEEKAHPNTDKGPENGQPNNRPGKVRAGGANSDEALMLSRFEGLIPKSGKSLKLRNLLPMIQKYGWFMARSKGSHMQFANLHDEQAGTISIPAHKTLSLGTALSIAKQVISKTPNPSNGPKP